MRLGIFGGTFDPVHYGHLLLAECCREQLRLDAVWFLPASVPPHKQQRQLAAAEARVDMLNLAIGGHEAFSVCRYEIDRGGVNFTADTLKVLAAQDPSRELFFLLGGDSLRDLPTWRDLARICRLAKLAVVGRAPADESSGLSPKWPELEALGSLLSADQVESIRRHRVEMPRVDLSSSDIRTRIAKGQSIRYRTPSAVEKYLETHQLYRDTTGAESPSRCPSGD